MTMPTPDTPLYKLFTMQNPTLEQVAYANVDPLDMMVCGRIIFFFFFLFGVLFFPRINFDHTQQGHIMSYIVALAKGRSPFPVLFVQSTTRWHNADKIASYLGINEFSLKAHALRELNYQRQTAALDPSLQARLERIYEPVRRVYRMLGNTTMLYSGSVEAQKLLKQISRCQSASSSGIPVCDI